MTLHALEVELTAGSSVLQLLGGEITEDDTRLPYVSGTVRIAPPADLEAVNPRTGAHITLQLRNRAGSVANFAHDFTQQFAGQPASALTSVLAGWTPAAIATQPGISWAGGTPSGRQWHLAIVDATPQDDGSLELAVESDDGPYSRIPYIGEGSEPLPGPWLRQALQLLEGYPEFYTKPAELLPGIFDAILPAGLDSSAATERQLRITPGQQLLAAVTPALQAANARLISGSRAGVELVSADWTTPARITVREGIELLQYDPTLDADSDVWGDAVLIIYSAAKSAPGRPTISPSYNVIFGPAFTNPLVLELDAPSPIASFTIDDRIAPAQALLARAQRRAEPAGIQAAANFDAQPRALVRLELADRVLEGRVQAVTFSLEAPYTMTMRCNEMETVSG